jgi:hypothetical protein
VTGVGRRGECEGRAATRSRECWDCCSRKSEAGLDVGDEYDAGVLTLEPDGAMGEADKFREVAASW